MNKTIILAILIFWAGWDIGYAAWILSDSVCASILISLGIWAGLMAIIIGSFSDDS